MGAIVELCHGIMASAEFFVRSPRNSLDGRKSRALKAAIQDISSQFAGEKVLIILKYRATNLKLNSTRRTLLTGLNQSIRMRTRLRCQSYPRKHYATLQA
jgi:hypothetical protein